MERPPCPHCGSRSWSKEDYDKGSGSVYRVFTCNSCGKQLTQTLYEDRRGVMRQG